VQPELEAPHDRAPYGADSVLFHGPAFELVERVRGIGPAGIEVDLRGVERAGWNAASWRVDVAALDGALQAALLWHDHAVGGPSLPTRAAEARFFAAAPPRGLLRCRLAARKSDSLRSVLDVAIFDEQGRCYAELEGVQVHARARRPALLTDS
jgi:hypothetical protein